MVKWFSYDLFVKLGGLDIQPEPVASVDIKGVYTVDELRVFMAARRETAHILPQLVEVKSGVLSFGCYYVDCHKVLIDLRDVDFRGFGLVGKRCLADYLCPVFGVGINEAVKHGGAKELEQYLHIAKQELVEFMSNGQDNGSYCYCGQDIGFDLRKMRFVIGL